jgi:NAD(P)-dependent dehydrogenase (short-subunit alcohol dehydrogenase family)
MAAEGRFAGRAALVTGGAGGIGSAVARLLIAEGARVAIVDLDEATARSAAETIGAEAIAANVSDPDDMRRAVDEAVAAFGRLDIAHLNAGVVTGAEDILEVSVENYRRAVSVNVDGVVFGIKAVVPAMERAGGGAIVATASLAGLVAYPVDPIYALCKHAVVGIVRGLGEQLSKKNITIAAVCPGFTRTNMLGEMYTQTFIDSGFPLLEPGEVAQVVADAAASGTPGGVYVVQPGVAVEYEFRGVPGPRREGQASGEPPLRPTAAHTQ